MGIYVGLQGKSETSDFRVRDTTCEETHPKYDIIYGPFKTIKDTENYGNVIGSLACSDG